METTPVIEEESQPNRVVRGRGWIESQKEQLQGESVHSQMAQLWEAGDFDFLRLALGEMRGTRVED
ncbi:MAG: hypothetical protein HW405_866 [Candidatus Berkelbacteria bacterium]|nr:hypothetical protein [Candidatus Berkelbacteria bacterium]